MLNLVIYYCYADVGGLCTMVTQMKYIVENYTWWRKRGGGENGSKPDQSQRLPESLADPLASEIFLTMCIVLDVVLLLLCMCSSYVRGMPKWATFSWNSGTPRHPNPGFIHALPAVTGAYM